jgi:Phage integrase family
MPSTPASNIKCLADDLDYFSPCYAQQSTRQGAHMAGGRGGFAVLGALALAAAHAGARFSPMQHTNVSRGRACAKLPFPVHAHMLRHACGYALANAGHDTRALQDWLGHKNIQHTVRYTELSPTRFKDFWRA